MTLKYLFPNRFKKIGWFVFIPSVIMGLVAQILNFEPDFLDLNVPALFIDELFKPSRFIGFTKNNVLNEIMGVLTIVSGLVVAFSKEAYEDEFISKIRLESLVWATYWNYIILLLAFVTVYDFSFFWVMLLNMFTTLLLFIIRFNWTINRLNKTSEHA